MKFHWLSRKHIKIPNIFVSSNKATFMLPYWIIVYHERLRVGFWEKSHIFPFHKVLQCRGESCWWLCSCFIAKICVSRFPNAPKHYTNARSNAQVREISKSLNIKSWKLSSLIQLLSSLLSRFALHSHYPGTSAIHFQFWLHMTHNFECKGCAFIESGWEASTKNSPKEMFDVMWYF